MNETMNPLMGGGNERNQAMKGAGDKNLLVNSGQQQYYITMNEISFVNSFGTIHLSQSKKRKYSYFHNHSIYLYTIYKFKYILWSYK